MTSELVTESELPPWDNHLEAYLVKFGEAQIEKDEKAMMSIREEARKETQLQTQKYLKEQEFWWEMDLFEQMKLLSVLDEEF